MAIGGADVSDVQRSVVDYGQRGIHAVVRVTLFLMRWSGYRSDE
jgi:hypothetical protein